MELSKDADKKGEKGSYLRVPNCITSVTLTSTANVSSFNYYYKFFNMRLKRQLRMNSRSEFLRVRNDGKSYSGKYLVLGLLEDQKVNSGFKFGIIVTKKIGNAVMRTLIRRRIKGIISSFGETLDFSGYMVVIPRYLAKEASYENLESDWKRLVKKAGIGNLKNNNEAFN